MLVISFYIWNPIIKNTHQYLPDDVPKHLVPEILNAIDMTFGVCVYLIYETGELLGLSYNETNIWIFVIIMPFLILLLSIYCISLKIKIRKLTLCFPK
ncbi:MAG: hypothetical protein ACJAVA_000165 [Flavobacteriaceae bacterium]|jgi:hypothetical protein